MKIGTNLVALKGQHNLNRINDLKAKHLEALTTGHSINASQDDAAGLSIATKFDSQVRGIRISINNAMDGCSMLESAESAMGEVTEILQRLRELTLQLASDSYGDEERTRAKVEMDELVEEVDRISESVKFNGKVLLDGNATDIALQIGPDPNDTLTVDLPSVSADDLGINDLDISDNTEANNSLETIDNALTELANSRATVGSRINRLNYAISNLNTLLENTSSALSRIIDTDMAYSMGEYSKYNILTQSGMSILAQSMQAPNQVLQLLQQ